jgi:hypothetical protein
MLLSCELGTDSVVVFLSIEILLGERFWAEFCIVGSGLSGSNSRVWL